MRIVVPKEMTPGEARVPLVPETVKRLVGKGISVSVQAGAGETAYISDAEYTAAGATIESSLETLLGQADIVVMINPPEKSELFREGSSLISFLYPLSRPERAAQLARRKVTVIAMDMIPRTTLAQSMDALSSQANISGYKAVVIAAERLPKLFPMMMTAAGTITPAKVLILGAGVAGLQAIATARRLGAVVEAFDVRSVVKEQVESLGAKFVEVEGIKDAAGSGGYARELTEEEKTQQRELVHRHVAKSDAVITTALIPGKRAPILVTEAMIKEMRPGSVIVDLAAEQGGNCEGTEPGKEVIKHGVRIVGHPNLPSTVALHASQLYSRNVEKLLGHLLDKSNAFKMDLNDEITKGCVITREGEVIHPQVKDALAKAGGS